MCFGGGRLRGVEGNDMTLSGHARAIIIIIIIIIIINFSSAISIKFNSALQNIKSYIY